MTLGKSLDPQFPYCIMQIITVALSRVHEDETRVGQSVPNAWLVGHAQFGTGKEHGGRTYELCGSLDSLRFSIFIRHLH